jgi:flagellin-like protein
MQLKKLLADDNAVSPVIGVILMVAITVILAAVIGTFVLGLGDQVQEQTPQATFAIEDTTINQSGVDEVTVAHEGGDNVFDDETTLQIENTNSGDSVEANADIGTGVGLSTGEDIVITLDTTTNPNEITITYAGNDAYGTGSTAVTHSSLDLGSGDKVEIRLIDEQSGQIISSVQATA